MAWGEPCGKERAHEDVRVPEKPERAHMQAQGDMEGRDAVEGGEDMKSTKRFKAALAAVLVLALSPLFGGAAFADGSSATTYSGNVQRQQDRCHGPLDHLGLAGACRE